MRSKTNGKRPPWYGVATDWAGVRHQSAPMKKPTATEGSLCYSQTRSEYSFACFASARNFALFLPFSFIHFSFFLQENCFKRKVTRDKNIESDLITTTRTEYFFTYITIFLFDDLHISKTSVSLLLRIISFTILSLLYNFTCLTLHELLR